MNDHPHVRRRALLALLAAAVLMPLARPARAEAWVVWKSEKSTLQLYAPAGWTVEEQGPVVELKRYLTGEQALVVAVPTESQGDARAFGERILASVKEQYPDLTATAWREGHSQDADIQSSELTYTGDGAPFRGACCAIATARVSVWVSYSAPAGSYSAERSTAMLATLLESGFPQGEAATAPLRLDEITSPSLPASRLEAAGRAFVFVLEFALTAPFTAEQETLILAELLDGWAKLPEDGFAQVEAYNQLARAILHGDGDALEALRGDLVAVTSQWLEETDQGDPAVTAVREQLESKGKVVAAGEPALTEVAASAYAEMYAFSEQLAEDEGATPADVDPRAVDSTRQRLEAAWEAFDQAEREAVASCPALWLTLRAALTFGTPEEGQTARARIASISDRATEPGDGGGQAGGDAVERMIRSTTMLQIQQQTFNTYMWSRGFHETRLGW